MNFGTIHRNDALLLSCAVALGAGSYDASAQSSIYRCAGNPPLFTSDQRMAVAKNCASIGSETSVARIATSRKQPVANESGVQNQTAVRQPVRVASVDSSARSVSPEQKARDSDRLTILTSELQDEKTKFETLKQKQAKASSSATPGDQTVAELTKALARSQSDISALEREISRAR